MIRRFGSSFAFDSADFPPRIWTKFEEIKEINDAAGPGGGARLKAGMTHQEAAIHPKAANHSVSFRSANDYSFLPGVDLQALKDAEQITT
jgi:hypothetical protein